MQRPTIHYLGSEGKRNREHAPLFQRLLHIAFGPCDVIVGHHVNFQFDGDLSTEDEVPAADTVLFDHTIMRACFGDNAVVHMATMAALKPGERERYCERELDRIGAPLTVDVRVKPLHQETFNSPDR